MKKKIKQLKDSISYWWADNEPNSPLHWMDLASVCFAALMLYSAASYWLN